MHISSDRNGGPQVNSAISPPSHLSLYADSVNASVILFHPTLLRGSTVTQITDKGNLLVYGSLVNIFAAAAASGPYDS